MGIGKRLEDDKKARRDAVVLLLYQEGKCTDREAGILLQKLRGNRPTPRLVHLIDTPARQVIQSLRLRGLVAKVSEPSETPVYALTEEGEAYARQLLQGSA